MQETKDLQRDIWRYLEKKHKQKTKVQTHSWDEKNSWTMIDGRKKGENVKTKDLQRDIWRHLEKKNNKNKGLR